MKNEIKILVCYPSKVTPLDFVTKEVVAAYKENRELNDSVSDLFSVTVIEGEVIKLVLEML